MGRPRGGGWAGAPDPPGKSQLVAIGFLRYSGTDPSIATREWSVRPSVKYLTEKSVVRTPTKFSGSALAKFTPWAVPTPEVV